MRRREHVQSGHVNFPMDLPSSGEGGMFVRLWVMDSDEGVGECCGTYTIHEIQECFIGSDITKQKQSQANLKVEEIWNTPKLTNEDIVAAFDEEGRLIAEATQDIICHERIDGITISHPLLVDVLMGSSGWSNSDFICEYTDLTNSGKVIYDTIHQAYPDQKIALVTFLDT